MANGKLKVRGIEVHRGDTPKLISNLQEAMLAKLTPFCMAVLID
jgi:hypothetical protein